MNKIFFVHFVFFILHFAFFNEIWRFVSKR